MRNSTNVPYVKQFDKNGVCTNPITHDYMNYNENRRIRRADKSEPRFIGNSKGMHLMVIKNAKYYRMVQWIKCKLYNAKKQVVGFKMKRILHYVLAQ